jgi:hypothetical protein
MCSQSERRLAVEEEAQYWTGKGTHRIEMPPPGRKVVEQSVCDAGRTAVLLHLPMAGAFSVRTGGQMMLIVDTSPTVLTRAL